MCVNFVVIKGLFVVNKNEYPVFNRNAYFSPNRIFGEDFGLNYDYYTKRENDFTYGKVKGTVQEYNELRRLIESLPELQPYEMRAFCCVPWDDAGTSIAFAMADRNTHKLKPATPFCGVDFGWPEFFAHNPLELVKGVLKRTKMNAGGQSVTVGQYLALNMNRQYS